MIPFQQGWALPGFLMAFAVISGAWYRLVYENVPDPYLVSYQANNWEVECNFLLTGIQDEFFHVPQAQRYCNNDYTWDPKITTPPGLRVLPSRVVEQM